MEIIGWISQISLALCIFPQLFQTIKEKHADGINWLFLLLWYAGEIFGFIYIVPLNKWPLIINYGNNLICMTIILVYKIIGSKK